MTGAFLLPFLNAAIACVAGGTFLILGRLRGAPAAVRGFGVCYLIGGFAAVCLMIGAVVPSLQGVARGLSVVFLGGSFHLMARALARYYRVALADWILALSFALALGLSAWTVVAHSGLLVQLPAAMGMGLCTLVVVRRSRGALDWLLAAVLAVAGLHFLLWPVVRVLLAAGMVAPDGIGRSYMTLAPAITGRLMMTLAFVFVLVVAADLVAMVQRQADQDGLSGLLNRRAFDREAATRVAAADPVVALMFDLDHFKRINDTRGHAAGDRIIELFAAALRTHLPADAVIGRTGGEEFSVLVTGVASEAVWQAAETLREAVAAGRFSADGIRYTVSGGLATRRTSEGLPSLMQRADRALYAAKAAGRNRILGGDDLPDFSLALARDPALQR